MASGNLLYDAGSSNPVLCDNLETLHGMRGGRKFKTGELCVYLWLIHVDVWQKLTQYCKAIILQLKNKIKKQTRRSNSEKAMAPHSSTLAWKITWTEEPSRLQSMGSRGVRHSWATSLSFLTLVHWRRKWQPTPVFLPGQPQGRGSLVDCRLWGHPVRHNWSDLAAAAAQVEEINNQNAISPPTGNKREVFNVWCIESLETSRKVFHTSNVQNYNSSNTTKNQNNAIAERKW